MPPTSPPPPGVLDASVETRRHGDVFLAYAPAGPHDTWLVCGDWSWTQSQALAAAAELASGFGVGVGHRVLVRTSSTHVDQRFLAAVVAMPIVTDGSVVLLTDPDADASDVASRERCEDALDLDGLT